MRAGQSPGNIIPGPHLWEKLGCHPFVPMAFVHNQLGNPDGDTYLIA
jgi:hypothetical protein